MCEKENNKPNGATIISRTDELQRLQSWFADNYDNALDKFRSACRAANVDVESYTHPLKGPNGQALSTDVAYFGKPDANNILILISGTHGPELLVGSGCQISWIDNQCYQHLPDDNAVLLIHAINPYGAAWRCRYTEDNVDLNRNFVDHSAPYPKNPRYPDVHEAVSCRQPDGPEREAAEQFIKDYCEQHGEKQYIDAVSQGQYTHPDGLFFGGNEPAWSNQTLQRILKKYIPEIEKKETTNDDSQRVAVIDYHSGMGPFGYGQPINMDKAGSDAFKRCLAWYGDSLVGTQVSQDEVFPVSGGVCQGVVNALPNTSVTAIALEFGTFDKYRVGKAMGDHACLLNPELDAALTETLRREIQTAFYPGTDDWLEMVWVRSNQIIRQALKGLCS